jgi:SAM-dependent methyltransferase
MHESIKAIMRRNQDRRFATTYLIGDGIDIGCGEQPISLYAEFYPGMRSLKPWDLPDGDGALLEGVEDEIYDFVHSSHSLEHMSDPRVAMANWIRVLKKGGHMVLLLPDEDMFEQGNWPSAYAGADHITSWTIKKNQSWCPASINVVDFLSEFADSVEILKIEKLDSTYLYNIEAIDQTRTPIGECAIEVVLRKKTDEELERKGRLPRQKVFSYKV